ncbi:MAG: bifunctional oligoribonuclease/PAP phosphatase NrnA, partial [Clostridia bacterium]|nr:bifunctional oligoribonuclease/PAP phosphatase NrnA [Clostridia bacterium]
MSLISYIKSSKDILIVCHIRPDGDSLGSGFALKLVAEKFGKRVDFVCDSDKPRHYEFLTNFDQLNNPQLKSYDTVIS